MFDTLTKFLSTLTQPESAASAPFGEDDPRVAAASLMFQVIDADGVREDIEVERLRQVLARSYNIDGAELDQLIAAGDEAESQAIDLYAATKVLRENLDHPERLDFVELLWEIVYADGSRHELEESIVWRVAELMGIERAERIERRQRVEGRLSLDNTSADG